MTLVQNIKTFIQSHSIQGTKATWGLFFLYAFVIFITVIASHWFLFHSVLISSLWKNTSIFFAFWLPKITISLFLAFFILISKRKWWTVVLLFFIDIWIIANIIYARANDCLLTWDAMMMAGNLEGFGSSIGFYWNEQCWFFIVLTLIYALCVPWFNPQPSKIGATIIGVITTILYLCGTQLYLLTMEIGTEQYWRTFANYIPFNIKQSQRHTIWSTHTEYTNLHSTIASFPKLINAAIVDACTPKPKITFTPEEEIILKQVIQKDDTVPQPKLSLYFILIESLENFALHVVDENNKYILPNLHNLLANDNVLYASALKSQVRHGVSADGQMITNTGLLPLQNGCAAMIYGKNTFPSYVHLYPHSCLSNPANGDVWNQDIISHAYGYKVAKNSLKNLNDAGTFNRIKTQLPTYQDSLFCYLAITIDSHSPFHAVPKNPTLRFNSTIPQAIQDYLTCLHYTDSCFGVWYDEWKETEQEKNTVLVITGDHTIFKDAMLQEFQPYAQQAGLSIASGKTYCPLIIQAPQITENIQITDVCYQMDVYPTLMHLIGCEDYYWKGLGVNLLDSTARHNRPITEEQAYQLSDKLIRADYFRELQP